MLGTSPVPERSAFVDVVVTPSREPLERSLGAPSDAGSDVESTELVERALHRPFDHFDEDDLD